MEQKKQYTSLSKLVDQQFTVEEAYGFEYRKWDQASGRKLRSDKWEEGFKKEYDVKTDKGNMSLSQGQLGQLLTSVYSKGEANIVGKTFHVKTNGKSGMEIRYFLNLVRDAQPKEWNGKQEELEEAPINMDDIPF